MSLKHNQISYIGGILFLTGSILILVAWHFTYPIYMPESNEITFTQFYPTFFPGLFLSVIGLFLAGYYCKKKSIQVLCVAIFPIVLYSYTYFYSYTPTSDSAAVKAMFQLFHQPGVGSSLEPYFQFPAYFTLNEVTSQILGVRT